ncbi:uncharacterized protein LOC113213385 [Frankliniella occidentalis]|uniref:Uncharacterized protein LOC113213385 n=1 Tax=Frankliniella occidentalis TaxID=133901 RepID=A0A6J1T4I4_FRAOC|nr:uncharacterized protein LOC113213385 [Frankliniella occidentalis]
MDCSICFEEYNHGERSPKMVPCGHTVCLQCLLRSDKKECPMCRTVFTALPASLPKNFDLLRLIGEQGTARGLRGWCSDCRQAASHRCWNDEHDVLPVKRALTRQLQGVLPQAAGQIEGLQDQCQWEQALQALTLMATESWNLTLQGGDKVLTGTLTLMNKDDPLMKALWVALAVRASLTEVQPTAPPAESASLATRKPPAAARPPPKAEERPSAQRVAPGGPAPPPSARITPTASRECPATGWRKEERNLLRVLDVRDVSQSGPNDMKQEKAAALLSATGVERLVDVCCHMDPEWSLALLCCAAPTVVELKVSRPQRIHLEAVHAMPRLRGLHLTCDGSVGTPELPALPPGHGGLQRLRVSDLPRPTLRSLLRAHAQSLRVLELAVGTAAEQDAWPESCADLHALLAECGLRALQRLVLQRVRCSHKPAACSRQRAEVRCVLPAAEVLCGRCDRVVWESL